MRRSTRPRRTRTKRTRRRVVILQPLIRIGRFAGRTVESLSDEDLQSFLTGDARRQYCVLTKNPFARVIPGGNPYYLAPQDWSYYWRAKWVQAQRQDDISEAAHLNFQTYDDPAMTVRDLFKSAFRAAALQTHPDVASGTGDEMRRLNEARDWLRTKLGVKCKCNLLLALGKFRTSGPAKL